jgi:hypothetical protein
MELKAAFLWDSRWNESAVMYRWVLVGFRYKSNTNLSIYRSTITSKKGILPFSSFSKVNCIFRCCEFSHVSVSLTFSTFSDKFVDIPQPNSRKQRLQIGFESSHEHISNERRQETSHTCSFSLFENLAAKFEIILSHPLLHYVDIARNLVSVYSTRYQPFIHILESQIDWNARK